jgi:type VI secretion system protein ImpA
MAEQGLTMLDFEKLLIPIREGAPAGDNLRYVDGDLTFRRIEELRVDEDPALVIEGNAKSANWPGVVRTCEEALATSSKDLEIAAFLTEGLAHTQGFEGVRDGLRLLKEMLATFWDSAHPGIDEGEVVLPIRAKPLNWLALPTGLVRAVKSVPFVTGHEERPLGYADLEMSERVDGAQLRDQTAFKEMTEAGFVTGETWRQALSNTPRQSLEQSLEALEGALVELNELDQLCAERFGDDEAPRLIGLRESLEDIRDRIAPQVRPLEEEAAEEDAAVELGAAPAASASAGPIASRQDALRTLGLVADFFRRTEPHSPISYLVQRAVRWGNMPLDELLREVVKSDDALRHIWETLGIHEGGD